MEKIIMLGTGNGGTLDLYNTCFVIQNENGNFLVDTGGGVMFALGWQREDAEGKSRGLMTLMAGFMLVAIAQSKNLFGL